MLNRFSFLTLSIAWVVHFLVFQAGTFFLSAIKAWTGSNILILFVLSLLPFLLVLSWLDVEEVKRAAKEKTVTIVLCTLSFVILIWLSVSHFSLNADVMVYHQPRVFYAMSHGSLEFPDWLIGRAINIYSGFDYYIAPYILIFQNPYAISFPNAILAFLSAGLLLSIGNKLALNKWAISISIALFLLNPIALNEVVLVKNHLVTAFLFLILFEIWLCARKAIIEPDADITSIALKSCTLLQLTGIAIFSIKSIIVIPAFFISLVFLIDLISLIRNKRQVNYPLVVLSQFTTTLFLVLIVLVPFYMHQYVQISEEQWKSVEHLNKWLLFPPRPDCLAVSMQHWAQFNLNATGLFNLGNPEYTSVCDYHNFYDSKVKPRMHGHYFLPEFFWIGIPAFLFAIIKGKRAHKIIAATVFMSLVTVEALYLNSKWNFRFWFTVLPVGYLLIGYFITWICRHPFLNAFVLCLIAANGILNLHILRKDTGYIAKQYEASKELSTETLNSNDGQIILAFIKIERARYIFGLYHLFDKVNWNPQKIEIGQFTDWTPATNGKWGSGDDKRFTHYMLCTVDTPPLRNRIAKLGQENGVTFDFPEAPQQCTYGKMK